MNQNNENLKWVVACFRVIYVFTAILCLITGYGSKGGTHKIRTAILERLEEYKNSNRIKAFILGGDIDYGEKYIAFLKSAPKTILRMFSPLGFGTNQVPIKKFRELLPPWVPT